ncbi:MAG: exodeoxyribonuclease VII small subunit [Pseudomonadota bacterium]|nr:exodeoxyribonuclease VII small subunit [Pseudomonadota bacterium]
MNQKKIDQMTYEEALNELEKIVSELESGRAELDKSIELYTRGSQLKDHCDDKLRSAEEKIAMVAKESGKIKLQIKPTSKDTSNDN